MSSQRCAGVAREKRRGWCLEPMLLRDPDAPEAFEGGAILNEFRNADGLLLSQLYRDVLLWVAAVDPQQLFRPDSELLGALLSECGLCGEERAMVDLLIDLLSATGTDRVQLSYCCRTLAHWALSAKKPRTAIAFLQAAALAADSDTALMVEVAVALGARKSYRAAETWANRAVGLARRKRDRAAYAEGSLELGRLLLKRGSIEDAEASLLRARRMASRCGMRGTTAHADHELFRLALAREDWPAAENYAAAARRGYGRNHRQLPVLQHEHAEMLVHRGANVEEAIRLLQRALPLRRNLVEKTESLIVLVRAADLAEDHELVASTWYSAVKAIECMGETAEAARFLLCLARSTRAETQHTHSAEAARRAQMIAMRVNEASLAAEAKTLRDELRGERR